MKKRLLTIIFAFTAMLCCIFGLSACGKDEPKKEKDEIAFTTLLLNEDNAYVTKVSNATTEFSFADEIKRFGNANFVVSSDKYGSQTYLTKVVPLQIGDNEFYILESGQKEIVTIYKVVIRRRPMYTVAFNMDGGISVENQRVEEDSFVSEPTNPTKAGYSLSSWDFDFATPITEDITITAEWINTEECFTVSGGTITGVSELFDRNSKKLYIPSTINGITITEIGDSAFHNCSSLASVVISNSVTSIGNSAFSNCSSLTSVVIPNRVTSIGYSAFSNCSSLTSVVIPDSVTSIGWDAFSGCSSLMSVVIPDSVTSIDIGVFYKCSSLTSVVIPDSVTSIGDWAFSNCNSLTSVIIPDSVKGIGMQAFQNCSSLTSVVIGNGVTSIGEWAFSGCSSLTYNKKDDLKYLGNSNNPYLYLVGTENESITTANIDSNCKFIGWDAFSGCCSLTSVIIPNSVTSIGYYAFYGCSSLTIYCEAESKPSGWANDWNSSNRPVVWGYKENE